MKINKIAKCELLNAFMNLKFFFLLALIQYKTCGFPIAMTLKTLP